MEIRAIKHTSVRWSTSTPKGLPVESPQSSIRNSWLDSPERWNRLADVLIEKGEAGYDSETYNQPPKTSPQHRTRLACWSIAVLTGQRHVRGYRVARGYALPREALHHPNLRAALQSIRLFAHNAPHDEHTAKNEGIDLVLHDTLQPARVAVPGQSSYSLKSKGKLIGIEQWALGKDARDNWKQLTEYTAIEIVSKLKTLSRCVCGRVPCRAKSTSEFLDPTDWQWKPHERLQIEQLIEEPKEVIKKYQANDFNPDHARWEAWLKYVIADAVTAIELVDWLRNRRNERLRYPWVSNPFGNDFLERSR